MLNYEMKGSFTDSQNFTWVYYQDDVNLSIFYVLPCPDWVVDSTGKPDVKLVVYQTDDAINGSGYALLSLQLAVPPEVVAGVQAQIAVQFPSAAKPYQLNPIDYNPGCVAEFSLTVKGTTRNFSAPASEFGSNVTCFRIDLDKDGIDTLTQVLSTAGGGLEVTYAINVPARLNAVTATLSFDSSIAYQYQVQHAQEHTYAADTPRIVNKLLQESASSKVDLKWSVDNPSTELQQAVSGWANATIATQVTAEAQKVMSVLNQSSYDSFNVSDISSFTSAYESDQVIQWKLYPKAALPIVADITDHIAKVDQRQQVMTVSVNLPFKGSKVRGANVPIVDAKEVLIKKITVKVSYPGLNEANSTHVFSANGSATFTAPYNEAQGDKYSLSWTADYAGGAQAPVSGQAADVTEGNYFVELADVGILQITFDARDAFAPLKAGSGQSPADAVTSIDIDFHFASPDGGGDLIHQKKTLKQPIRKPGKHSKRGNTQAFFTSYVAHNVITGTSYSFVTTYHFAHGPDWVGPAMTSSSYHENIPTPPAPHPVGLVIVAPEVNSSTGDSSNQVIEAQVNVWFKTDESIPGVGPQPTENNPTSFTLTPSSKGGGPSFARDTFYGFLNGDVPLVYSASITTMMNQINIQPTLIQNKQPTILVNPEMRYTTLTILMSEVDWSTNTYDQITLAVTGFSKVNGKKKQIGQELFVFSALPSAAGSQPGTNPPKYVTFSHLNTVKLIDFHWVATYITSGEGTTTAKGQGNSNKAPQIIVPAKGGSELKAPLVIIGP
ncbi:MAG: hypothetical protein V7742_14125 [Halioglobus sp.]